jgi:hypothetical protein
MGAAPARRYAKADSPARPPLTDRRYAWAFVGPGLPGYSGSGFDFANRFGFAMCGFAAWLSPGSGFDWECGLAPPDFGFGFAGSYSADWDFADLP